LKTDKKAYTSSHNLPISKEESPAYLISENGKLYPKIKYHVVERELDTPNKFFNTNDGKVRYCSYEIGKAADVENLLEMLRKIKAYLEETKETEVKTEE